LDWYRRFNTKERLELASKDAHVVILSAEQTVDDDQYFIHVGYIKLLEQRTQIYLCWIGTGVSIKSKKQTTEKVVTMLIA
jgi:hypothetical protein